ncbi:tyrosine-type recombinase/integrase, partial [Streptococcus hyovaginalis]
MSTFIVYIHPLLPRVKEALILEKKRQEELEIVCKSKIDGYTNFIFLNRFGNVFHQGTLNKALKRIIRDCNFAVLDGKIQSEVTLPNFSNYSLRHTFTTRMVEAGTNMKAMQEILGHSDISTTMNVYAEATKEFKEKETRVVKLSATSSLIARVPEVKLFGLAQTEILRIDTEEVVLGA